MSIKHNKKQTRQEHRRKKRADTRKDTKTHENIGKENISQDND